MVLDTHAWVWWVSNPERVPPKATRSLDRSRKAGDSLLISTISAWEVAMLVERGRLELTMDVESWIAKTEALPFVDFVPVDNRIALRSVYLTGFPYRDPADRLIVSTALEQGATLVTGDQRLLRYGPVKTVWK
jgi:PIN domain nuclease of toxin-antitoxin system